MQPYPCLLCGQATVTPSVTPPSPTPVSSTMEEITLITEQARRIDEAISVLHVTRAKLLRRLNDLQPSTSKLPPEILSEIFTDVSDLSPSDGCNEPEIHTQVTLGAVSTYWRQVVCSTPQLWASACINVKRNTVAIKAKLLQLYFRTVQDVPLSLHLHLRETDHNSPDFYPIIQALQEGAQKFIFLGLYDPPETWFSILSPHFHKLERLSLMWTWNDEDGRATDDIPRVSHLLNILSLRRVYLENCWLDMTQPNQPCHSITDLHLVSMGQSTCTQLLMLCPNLVSFRCESSFEDGLDDLPSYPAITTFHNMQFLQVPPAAAPFGGLLPRLRFPVLETVSTELDDFDVPSVENLLPFIQSLPATCLNFGISGSFNSTMIAELIQATPSQVQALRLINVESSDLAKLLLALCDNMGTTVLGLQHIVISKWSGENVVEYREDTIPQLFLNMVSERKELLGGHFLLEIDSEFYDDTPWTHLQGRLRALISVGFRLEVFVSGVLIPCLQEIYDELGYT